MPACDDDAGKRCPTTVRIACVLLTIYAGLVAWDAYVTGPNLDEPAHLAAGISHWTFGNFDLYRVNPPLVKLIASIPVLATNYQTDWQNAKVMSAHSRVEFHVGRDFVLKNGMNSFWYFTLARWACLPFCLLGAWTVFLWARDLYGNASALIGIWLYCFCPNLIGWGASITPDSPAAATGVFAAYQFYRWLKNPTKFQTLLAGFAFGIALLTKGTWIILIPLFPVIWAGYRLFQWRDARRALSSSALAPELPQVVTPVTAEVPATTAVPTSQVRLPVLNTSPQPAGRPETSASAGAPSAPKLAVILVLGVYLLNFGYGFEGSFQFLGDFRFISKSLSGEVIPPYGANRFAGTWLHKLPVPLPANYVLGVDTQKKDFEFTTWSFLFGEQRLGGWWYYYLAGLGLKTPIGTLILFGLATVLALFSRRYRTFPGAELAFLLPSLAVLILVSSQTGMNRYLRYVLPFVPFALIHCSRIGLAVANANRWLPALTVVCLCATTVETMSVYPYSLSFFNRFAGGPLNGHNYLLDSNIDWAQDTLNLKKWYDDHPEARPFHYQKFGTLVSSPEATGMEFQPVPGYLPQDQLPAGDAERPGPQPGWFALSINHIKGYKHYFSDKPEFTYFQRLKPVGRAGYSIYIYHLTLDQANALRAEFHLPPLPADPPTRLPNQE